MYTNDHRRRKMHFYRGGEKFCPENRKKYCFENQKRFEPAYNNVYLLQLFEKKCISFSLNCIKNSIGRFSFSGCLERLALAVINRILSRSFSNLGAATLSNQVSYINVYGNSNNNALVSNC